MEFLTENPYIKCEFCVSWKLNTPLIDSEDVKEWNLCIVWRWLWFVGKNFYICADILIKRWLCCLVEWNNRNISAKNRVVSVLILTMARFNATTTSRLEDTKHDIPLWWHINLPYKGSQCSDKMTLRNWALRLYPSLLSLAKPTPSVPPVIPIGLSDIWKTNFLNWIIKWVHSLIAHTIYFKDTTSSPMNTRQVSSM